MKRVDSTYLILCQRSTIAKGLTLMPRIDMTWRRRLKKKRKCKRELVLQGPTWVLQSPCNRMPEGRYKACRIYNQELRPLQSATTPLPNEWKQRHITHMDSCMENLAGSALHVQHIRTDCTGLEKCLLRIAPELAQSQQS